MSRSVAVLVRTGVTCVLVVLLVSAVPPVARADHGLAPASWLGRPVDGEVVAPFEAPTRYGPGHRGVDIAAPFGTTVVAAGAGVVTFAGTVVGHRWVTVDHGGLRSTVGPLASIAAVRGQRVVRGTPLGTSGLAHGEPAVHLSVRVGDRYVDPLRVRGPVVSLLPTPPPAGAVPDREPRGATVAQLAGRTIGADVIGSVPAVGSGPGAWRTRVR